MNQLIEARKGNLTSEMELIVKSEGVTPDYLLDGVASGVITVVKNNLHDIFPLAVGKGLRTKVNANIGASLDCPGMDQELEKLKVAIKYGADAIMDLSTGGDISQIRQAVMKASSVAVGTVPIYQAMVQADRQYGSMVKLRDEELFSVVEEHGRDGVDFITIHCGINLDILYAIKKHAQGSLSRSMGVVSRGGAFTLDWMDVNGRENPFYSNFDRLVEIAKRYDMVISLGDGLRPGAIADATDDLQVEELITLGRLAGYAREEGVGVIIEGPGHVPMDQIAMNIKLQKSLCKDAPFYVLGPIVTDVAPGYDHITAAIGGAMAASAGADFLCYVTPAEHLRLPTPEDVREGMIATRIAAHAGDIAKGIKGAKKWDARISASRKALNWQAQQDLSIDPEKFKEMRASVKLGDEEVCSMCGSFCSIKIQNNQLGSVVSGIKSEEA